MLQIFWDTKENPKIKREIQKSLSVVYRNLSKDSFFDSHQEHNISLIFTNSKKIKELNNTYRNKNESTDVLSFSELDYGDEDSYLQEKNSLGEIYLNYEWVKDENKKMEKWGSGEELVSILFIHGMLHLIGLDHEKDKGEMEKLENKLRKELV